MKARTTKKVWITVRYLDGADDIQNVFDSYEEIHGIYDYIQEVVISITTYNRLKDGYTPVRYANTIRAKQF